MSASREPRHPIRVVAMRTGIGLHALRAWERRYGVVAPERTEGGQRLYSDADIERLKLLRDAVSNGRSISQVAELGDEELAELVAQDRALGNGPPVRGLSRDPDVERYVEASLQAAMQMDEDALHRVLMRALVSLRPFDLIDGVIGPLLHEVGERWHAGRLSVAKEHLVSVGVRRVLTVMLTAYEAYPDAPAVVVTTVAEDAHEFGAMLAAVYAAEAGWRVVYLGASLTAEEIAQAAGEVGAEAVALSAVTDRGAAGLRREVERLRGLLPAGVRLLVGGRVAERHAAELEGVVGVELMDLRTLREALPPWRPGPGSDLCSARW